MNYLERDSYYVMVSYLTSKKDYYPDNEPDNFLVKFKKPLSLKGQSMKWKVGLCEVDFVNVPHKNISSDGDDVPEENEILGGQCAKRKKIVHETLDETSVEAEEEKVEKEEEQEKEEEKEEEEEKEKDGLSGKCAKRKKIIHETVTGASEAGGDGGGGGGEGNAASSETEAEAEAEGVADRPKKKESLEEDGSVSDSDGDSILRTGMDSETVSRDATDSGTVPRIFATAKSRENEPLNNRNSGGGNVSKKDTSHYIVDFSNCEGLSLDAQPSNTLRYFRVQKDECNVIFKNVYYVPVNRSYIDSCALRIKPLSTTGKVGKTVFSKDSCIILTLHFKKK